MAINPSILPNILVGNRAQVTVYGDVIYYFDEVGGRIRQLPTAKQARLLQENASHVDVREAKRPYSAIRTTRRVGQEWYLTIVGPNHRALHILQELDFIPNKVELARDVLMETEEEVSELKDLFDKYFVQSWHGSRETQQYEETTYTGQGRHSQRFAWYRKEYNKITGELYDIPRFHAESRVRGRDRLQRLGINNAEDLIKFNHREYWKPKLEFRFTNTEALGKSLNNGSSGQRAIKARVERRGRFEYHKDRRAGKATAKAVAAEVAIQRGRVVANLVDESVQHLIDSYGKNERWFARIEVAWRRADKKRRESVANSGLLTGKERLGALMIYNANNSNSCQPKPIPTIDDLGNRDIAYDFGDGILKELYELTNTQRMLAEKLKRW